tara:strand:+ start:534 stop:1421 length:888 start_codon:yes stop_codon:yes gene_type:complete
MPLTAKGEKLKAKFKEQYGNKKGESVFYAMENSGKLKKVIKARGGSAALAAAAREREGYGKSSRADPTGGVDRSAVSKGSQYQKNVTAANVAAQQKAEKQQRTRDIIFTPTPFATVNLAKNLIFDPLKKKSRTQKARGETFLGKPKDLPATKDYYKLTGNPLDVMSKKGEDFMKKAGLIGAVKPVKPGRDGRTRCPDGTLPPCKPIASSTGAPSSVNKKSDISFLKDMTFYPANLKSGGVPYGPPPKSGPNPQVPPVKMKNGKMTKKYKMSCPHRPDGIRGVGAAIKGHKFIGVK